MSKKITIEPITRVEGHGKVTIKIDDEGKVLDSRLHIVEFRGFERFIQGRPYWEAPVLVQRLCGICPVSHHLAAAKALDVIVGAGTGDGLTAVGEKMRRLMHFGQFFQSHVLHFFHLSSPDFLFGINADPAIRNVIGVIDHHKDLAVQGVMMRKYGQEIISHTAGKKIHGTGAIPGGINKNLSKEERNLLLKGPDPLNAKKMVKWSVAALEFFKAYHSTNKDMVDTFAEFPSNHLSLVRKDGALDIYNGVLRAVDANGNRILDDVDCQDYDKYIEEEVRNWSYMKFPYLKHLGKEKGWYRVGPLARLNVVDFIPTPLAQKEFEEFKAYTHGKPNNMSLHYHWARLIEVLYAAEEIRKLLKDPDLQNDDLVIKGEKTNKGVGVIEAPRGTLFHHYEINDNDQITLANLIVSTTNNNEPMNQAVNHTAKSTMNNQMVITEGMMNAVEVAIRAYDPCLSCATHALGKMPLEITLVNENDEIINTKIK
ncbi:MAG: Ni/Fe hydrogenase subunit alpha [Bacteroidetes bacterium]|nr:Ni/Fe hydrogenase subunit alpha [Bacteroidota bacterium]|tara:strand:- start:67 stop:1518 length:1452 start_codon:yes stop_codon:yes gene_type:complete